ncbi:hypothetical protein ABID21_001139 [Pseudorhizobium tarimense]|uniref:DUF6692 domain-containing protein n=1 Tax=Pseudorhizobium tarimense TaxID=1079109 RepID=A0ABV2H444_9HYPH|nr:DUF6692 family protein [Pseudorhizobium tarimense]MCJ8518538.1 hypothetical protein [Pseudorhizobium tarimense]
MKNSLLSLLLLTSASLLSGCGEQEAADDIIDPPRAEEVARVVPGEEAIAGADIPTLDPATMVDAEMAKVLGQPTKCTFRYTSAGKPVFALNGTPDNSATTAVVKVNGHLVELRPSGGDGNLVFGSGPVVVSLSVPGGDPEGKVDAAMSFTVDDTLRVGYKGYFQCAG